MLKRTLFLLTLVFLMLPLQPAHAQNLPPATLPPAAMPLTPVVHSHYAILVDAVSGKVLWERNPETPRPIASTTKMVTRLLLLEGEN